MTEDYKPTFVSLFAGVGGFDLGLERAGFTGIGQVEINDFCNRVLAKHWPEVPRHDDVQTAVEWWLSEPRPEVDVVCGGFPCQDISRAKADRKGLDGDRSRLYWDALAFVVAVQPRLVLLENVAGLLTSNHGRDLAVIQATMAECGYPYFEWRVLDSQFFGVPQRRRRVFLVASASDPRLGPLLLEPEGRGRDLAALSKARQGAARTAPVDDGEGGGGWPTGGAQADADGVREVARLSGRLDDAAAEDDEDEAEDAEVLDLEVAIGAGPDAAAPGAGEPALLAGNRTSEPVGLPVSTLQGSMGGVGAPRGYRIDAEAASGGQLIVPRHFQKVIRSGKRYPDGTLPPEVWAEREVTATLNIFDIGETRAVDIISDITAESIQPAGGCGCCPIDLAPDANRYGTCGNAVSVPVITWIGHRVWDELTAQRVAETEEWDGS